jgi:hypothetical protein
VVEGRLKVVDTNGVDLMRHDQLGFRIHGGLTLVEILHPGAASERHHGDRHRHR